MGFQEGLSEEGPLSRNEGMNSADRWDKHSSQREQALQRLWGGRMFDIPEGKW